MSAVPAAVDNLLAELRAASTLSGVRVFDGPPQDAPTEFDVVVIGWQPEESEAVEWSNDPASMAADDDSETFTVQGLVSVQRGDVDLPVARSRADEILEAVRAVVRADSTLGGAVTRSRLTTTRGTPIQDHRGCQYRMTFVIRAWVF